MLSTLRIKNLALVSDLTFDLFPGYNAITGETGAGKSIIIGALKLVLGERADRTLIRSGADSCSVEALFEIRKLAKQLNGFLEENGLEPCAEDQLILKRTFTAAGANRQFVNGSPVTLQVLQTLGESLVDMHGPHDHQSLLQPAKQLLILDAFGGLEDQRTKLGGYIQERKELLARKAALIVDERTYAQQVDLLRFQVREISTAKLQPGEEEQVEADYKRASNAARLLELAQNANGILAENEESLLTHAGTLGRTLADLARLDGQAGPTLQLHQQAIELLNELNRELSAYQDSVELDPVRLRELEERLNVIHTLKRKYGASLDDVIEFGNAAREKLHALESRDEELEKIQAGLKAVEEKLSREALALSAARRKVAPKLAKAVVGELHQLGFKQSEFQVNITTPPPDRIFQDESSFTATGVDVIEYLFGPNPGEPLKPLRSIASSGELARVMLGLKTVLAAEDQVPVLVFDEVDANVGGETASVVGKKMRQIGEKRQVLCITHLAPVAAASDEHFVVNKEISDGRTISTMSLLDKKARVTEIARMLGGQDPAIRKHAESLLR